MALILNGYSKCSICKIIINDDEEVLGFPAIFVNKGEKGYVLNDSGVHIDCLKNNKAAQDEVFGNDFLSEFLKTHYSDLWDLINSLSKMTSR